MYFAAHPRKAGRATGAKRILYAARFFRITGLLIVAPQLLPQHRAQTFMAQAASTRMAQHTIALACLNIVCPGLAQVLIGKRFVGIACLLLTNFSFISCLIWGATSSNWSKFTQFGSFCVFTVAVLALLSFADAIMSIRYKNKVGQVSEWQLFPVS